MILLLAGVSVDCFDAKGKSPLDLAIQHQHQTCINHLNKEGASALFNYQTAPLPAAPPPLDKGFIIDRYGWVISLNGTGINPKERRRSMSALGALDNHFYTDPISKKDTVKEQKREKKWKEMLSKWDSIIVQPKWQKKIRKAISKGIPNRLRGQAWIVLTGANKRKGVSGKSYDPVSHHSVNTKAICISNRLPRLIHVLLS